MNTGFPQGTVFLLILYVNDLLTSMHGAIIVSFADHTTVIPTDKSWQGVKVKIYNYLNIINVPAPSYKCTL